MESELAIQAAAAAIGLSVHTLRYYERSGLIDPVPRTASGYRAYGEVHLAQLRAMKRLREVGMSIRQIAAFMTHYRAMEYEVCCELLQTHQILLTEQQAHTQGYLKQLNTKIQVFRTLVEEQVEQVAVNE